ncbi:hypothetical protein HYPDE_31748 [Hyphomicrobium denitrificans 1NES1]|uniref:Uncharacterized protein n=1 Tax=Hyphomicrobium denitrificans 1NES1 TaxID=670307 RepID=N0B3F5_9HYPH|nr:hypothetical protein HYPDE_31748 [Hyphomicrobium denitrificans 1NES1]
MRGNIIELPPQWSLGHPEEIGMFTDAEKPFIVCPAPLRRTRIEKIFPQTSMLRQAFQTLLKRRHP